MCKNKNKNKVQRKLEIGKLLNIIQTIDQYIFRDLETLDKVPKYSVSSFFSISKSISFLLTLWIR